MTEPDDHGQPEAREALPPRRSRRGSTGPSGGQQSEGREAALPRRSRRGSAGPADGPPEAREALPPRRPRGTPTGAGDGRDGATRSEPEGAQAGSRGPDAPGTQAAPTDDGDLEAVNRLMAFLRDPETER
ncbi:MAG TPA: hypothetical protein VFZ68_04940 [Acidimicrobiales bacterium]